VRIHASSGTTGKPTTVGYTRGDIDVWSECMARTMAAAGVTEDDIVQNAYGYGLFTGGLGAHYGAERLGASVIPISGGNTQKQLMLMQDYGSTVLCSTPSFALYIWEVANEMGIDMASLPLRVGVFGAEPWSEAMRREIEEKLSIKAIDIYGLSEITGPGVSFECAEVQQGLHVNEDHFLAEIINPETQEPVADGELGELVFTTLSKEGIPLIRYRTGDITRLNVETCGCGRTLARMDRVSGRSDDMLIIRGVNVFPTQVESVLLMSREVEPHYQLIVEREGSMDTLSVEVEINCDLYKEAKEAILSDDDFVVLGEYDSLRDLRNQIKCNIKDIIGVTADIRLREPGAIERSEGKSKRVIDKRPK
jgi:phenylacetate-CoA ligase